MFSGDGGSARSFAIILVVHLAVIVLWQLLVDAMSGILAKTGEDGA